MPNIGDTKPDGDWMKWGYCKKCGKLTWIDCCRYCTPCYPYGDACDVYKHAVETDKFTMPVCDHNFYGDECTRCGAKQKKGVQG